jgi:hypothetical protein
MKAAIMLVTAAALVLAPASAANGDPTCSDVLDIAVHGQHVVGDYVTGVGHGTLGWPPNGQVGPATGGGGGPAVPGGPGPGFHFPNGFAPGASFCNPQSESPGFHVGG